MTELSGRYRSPQRCHGVATSAARTAGPGFGTAPVDTGAWSRSTATTHVFTVMRTNQEGPTDPWGRLGAASAEFESVTFRGETSPNQAQMQQKTDLFPRKYP